MQRTAERKFYVPEQWLHEMPGQPQLYRWRTTVPTVQGGWMPPGTWIEVDLEFLSLRSYPGAQKSGSASFGVLFVGA